VDRDVLVSQEFTFYYLPVARINLVRRRNPLSTRQSQTNLVIFIEAKNRKASSHAVLLCDVTLKFSRYFT